jgi:hypothetical protein
MLRRSEVVAPTTSAQRSMTSHMCIMSGGIGAPRAALVADINNAYPEGETFGIFEVVYQ